MNIIPNTGEKMPTKSTTHPLDALYKKWNRTVGPRIQSGNRDLFEAIEIIDALLGSGTAKTNPELVIEVMKMYENKWQYLVNTGQVLVQRN